MTAAETWTAARNSAKSINKSISTTDGSLTGYLSNITSESELSFLASKVPIGTGVFIGGSDAEGRIGADGLSEVAESRFYWMDGPKANLEFFFERPGVLSSLKGATAVPAITTGSSTRSEIRS